MTAISRSPREALADELGAVAAGIVRETRLQVAAALSEIREEMAALRVSRAESELRAVNAERAFADMVSNRLAEVRDGDPGSPGTSVDPAVVERLVIDHVATAIGELPMPEAVDLAVIAEMVAGEVAKLPQLDEVRANVAVEVERAVKSLPVPADGHTPTEAELTPIIETAISTAIAALPPPKDGQDGADGESVDPADVERMVAEAVAKLPLAERGEQGPQGEKGDPGESIKGDAGERGPEGPAGKLAAVKAWQRGVHYEGDVRTHDGSTYQALRDTAEAPPHDDWACLAAAGRAGADGRSLTSRGTWDGSQSYHALDFVMLKGSSFMARRDDPGECPGDGWQLIASAGSRGERGERVAGPKGDPGPAPRAMAIDDEGLLTLTNGDGSVVTCDLYPLLVRVQS